MSDQTNKIDAELRQLIEQYFASDGTLNAAINSITEDEFEARLDTEVMPIVRLIIATPAATPETLVRKLAVLADFDGFRVNMNEPADDCIGDRLTASVYADACRLAGIDGAPRPSRKETSATEQTAMSPPDDLPSMPVLTELEIEARAGALTGSGLHEKSYGEVVAILTVANYVADLCIRALEDRRQLTTYLGAPVIPDARPDSMFIEHVLTRV